MQATDSHMSAGAQSLVAVVVTYNRLAQLQITLPRLLQSPADELACVVVVDNASDDGTSEWLAQQKDPRVDVLSLSQNLGGAGGFEHGMARAMEVHAPDWLVLMDDDGRPEPGALQVFQQMDKTGWDALAAAVYFPDGKICEMNRPSRNPFGDRGHFLRTARRGRDGFHIPHEVYEGTDVVPIEVTSFVGFFISREAVEKVGLPEGRLFIYGDDGIYTLGLSRAGGRIGFVPQIRYEHDLTTFQGNGLAKGQRFRPLWKVYYHHRNLLLLYRLAAGWWFPLAFVIVAPKWLGKVRHHSGERRAFLRLMLRAIKDGLTRNLNVTHPQVLAWAKKDKP